MELESHGNKTFLVDRLTSRVFKENGEWVLLVGQHQNGQIKLFEPKRHLFEELFELVKFNRALLRDTFSAMDVDGAGTLR